MCMSWSSSQQTGCEDGTDTSFNSCAGITARMYGLRRRNKGWRILRSLSKSECGVVYMSRSSSYMYVALLIFLQLLSDDLRLGRFIFEVGKLVAKACEGFGKPSPYFCACFEVG
jgi:hypothetical protein